jgi:hypothetical protein
MKTRVHFFLNSDSSRTPFNLNSDSNDTINLGAPYWKLIATRYRLQMTVNSVFNGFGKNGCGAKSSKGRLFQAFDTAALNARLPYCSPELYMESMAIALINIIVYCY